jgi:hypothetical protein
MIKALTSDSQGRSARRLREVSEPTLQLSSSAMNQEAPSAAPGRRIGIGRFGWALNGGWSDPSA